MASGQTGDSVPELTRESDADLLVYMAMAEEDPHCARTAWGVFYGRHVDYLYRVCVRAYGDLPGGQAAAADVVAETFRLAFEKAHKFDPAGIEDVEPLRWRVRAWLGWIARRLVQDQLRSRRRMPTGSLEADHLQQLPGRDRPQRAPSAREELVRQAVLSLSEREQVVIRVTFQWYRPEQAHQRLPNDIAADLARTLGTTPENLRQIRRRALKKIADSVRPPEGKAEMREKLDG